jgi:glycerol-3-phosphate dehydrogenase subunit B
MILTNLFDRPEFRAEVVASVKSKLGQSGRIGFPAVLGLENPLGVKKELEDELGIPIFEIPTLPPSIPGIRLHNLLVMGIQDNGGRVFNGMQVISCETDAEKILSVSSEAAARRKIHRAENFLLATGGILGGGYNAHENGRIIDSVLDLPIGQSIDREDWFREEFLDANSHPVFQAGYRINKDFQPIDGEDKPIFSNLFVAGTNLAGDDFIKERSFDGIALVTGDQSARAILRKEMTNRVI